MIFRESLFSLGTLTDRHIKNPQNRRKARRRIYFQSSPVTGDFLLKAGDELGSQRQDSRDFFWR